MAKKASGGDKGSAAKSSGKGKPAKKKSSSAKTERPVPSPMDRNRTSITTRKISNGYLVTQSGYNRRGQYVERETFTPSQPKVTVSGKPIEPVE